MPKQPKTFVNANITITDFVLIYGDKISGHSKMVDFMFRYWCTLRETLPSHKPRRKDINPKDFTPYLDKVVLIDLLQESDGLHFFIRLIGTTIASYYGELTGQYVSAMANKEAADRLCHVCEQVIETQAPILSHTVGISLEHEFMDAWTIYLPLYSIDGTAIEKVLLCSDLKARKKNTA
ncbi:PAS domain-containing protein [Kordiimonas pumila]|uniref:PAS domain-containing protein n=1 Tax=Kordiimonas pumila TaxID=2161677 RepID=A0ABV7D044_9PROT|nr:PAS domain-containing protein [Kordiimonas pumila]